MGIKLYFFLNESTKICHLFLSNADHLSNYTFSAGDLQESSLFFRKSLFEVLKAFKFIYEILKATTNSDEFDLVLMSIDAEKMELSTKSSSSIMSNTCHCRFRILGETFDSGLHELAAQSSHYALDKSLLAKGICKGMLVGLFLVRSNVFYHCIGGLRDADSLRIIFNASKQESLTIETSTDFAVNKVSAAV